MGCRSWSDLQSTVEKKEEWNEWSFVMRNYASPLSPQTATLLAGAKDSARFNMTLDRIVETFGNPSVHASTVGYQEGT